MNKLLLNRSMILMIASSLILAALCLNSHTKGFFIFKVIHSGVFIADVMFHEVGHSIFGWLFGYFSLPSITTIFNGHHHAGLTLNLFRSVIIQIAAIGLLFYGCLIFYKNKKIYFYPALFFALMISIISFTKYHNILISYMGHGSAMLMGGFFLFRSLLYLDSRNVFERWLNSFFGFFLILRNIHLSYSLIYDPFERARYAQTSTEIIKNDFVKIAYSISSWTLDGVALFTILFGIAIIIITFILAKKYHVWRDSSL